MASENNRVPPPLKKETRYIYCIYGYLLSIARHEASLVTIAILDFVYSVTSSKSRLVNILQNIFTLDHSHVIYLLTLGLHYHAQVLTFEIGAASSWNPDCKLNLIVFCVLIVHNVTKHILASMRCHSASPLSINCCDGLHDIQEILK